MEWLIGAVIGYAFLLLLLGLAICIRGLPRQLLTRDPEAEALPVRRRENGPPQG